MADLHDAMSERPLVLDGGLGTLLEARGHDLASELWSARVLREQPEAVRAAHREFVAAGADVLISGSYQLGFGGVVPDDEVERLLARSVDVARDADATFVAASVGPYGAHRADGSEYTGAYGMTVDELSEWHRRRLHVLAESGADVLAIETIPALVEVEAICRVLSVLQVPAWVSLSADSSGWQGDDLAWASALAAETPGVLAVGVNCCRPASVLPALAAVRAGVPAVVYPNSGESWNATTRSWTGAAGLPTGAASEWIAAGARIVGGCCRTTPGDIAELAAVVRRFAGRSRTPVHRT